MTPALTDEAPRRALAVAVRRSRSLGPAGWMGGTEAFGTAVVGRLAA
ncbi:MAG TPA: hypothetical protein VFN50_01580 [Acidimicrobiales bacterium]|nr:hypothetical protein [Acidimicrobiales bacterium]